MDLPHSQPPLPPIVHNMYPTLVWLSDGHFKNDVLIQYIYFSFFQCFITSVCGFILLLSLVIMKSHYVLAKCDQLTGILYSISLYCTTLYITVYFRDLALLSMQLHQYNTERYHTI